MGATCTNEVCAFDTIQDRPRQKAAPSPILPVGQLSLFEKTQRWNKEVESIFISETVKIELYEITLCVS